MARASSVELTVVVCFRSLDAQPGVTLPRLSISAFFGISVRSSEGECDVNRSAGTIENGIRECLSPDVPGNRISAAFSWCGLTRPRIRVWGAIFSVARSPFRLAVRPCPCLCKSFCCACRRYSELALSFTSARWPPCRAARVDVIFSRLFQRHGEPK